MTEEKLRLGGMALANGVLVHGPTAWACAIRDADGELGVESGYKTLRTAEIRHPLLRGPARLVEAFLLLPELKRRFPAARLPFERPSVAATLVATAAGIRLVRASARLSAGVRELASGLLALVPAVVALRGSELAAYHGAEHVVIGTYEHGEERGKEHERCGSHLIGPLLATSALGNILAARAPIHLRGTARVLAGLGALAASTEIFGWMIRHPDAALSRALAKPGHELQHRLATSTPTPEQLEVAETALSECLRLEREAARAR